MGRGLWGAGDRGWGDRARRGSLVAQRLGVLGTSVCRTWEHAAHSGPKSQSTVSIALGAIPAPQLTGPLFAHSRLPRTALPAAPPSAQPLLCPFFGAGPHPSLALFPALARAWVLATPLTSLGA